MGRPAGSKNRPKDNVTPMKAPKTAKTAKAPKAAKPAKDAAPGIGHNDEEAAQIDCFNAYRDTLRPLEARLATVKTQIAKVYAQAKGDKFPKKLFAIATGLMGTRKQEQKIIGDIKLVRFAAKALNLPIANQLDFFVDAAADAGSTRPSPESEGREQYASGKAAKPPYPPGSTSYDEFLGGFYAAQEDATRKGIKALKPGKKNRNGHQAAAAPADDDEGDMDPPWPDDDGGDPDRPLAH